MQALLISLLSIICVIILLIIFLPQFSSTPWGREMFVKVAFSPFAEKRSVQSVSLSWLGPQEIKGMKAEGGEIEFSFDSLYADVSLFSLLTLGDLNPKVLNRIDGKIELKNGIVILPKQEAEFHQIEVLLQRKKKNTLTFNIEGITSERGQRGSFQLDGKIHPNPFSYKGNTLLDHFPVAGIDAIVAMNKPEWKGALLEILGPFLNLESTASVEEEGGMIDAKIDSTHLTSVIDASFHDNAITLNQNLVAAIQLTPSLSEYILWDANPLFLTGVEAKDPVELEISKEGFLLPLPYNVNTLKMNTKLSMGQIRCKNGGTIGLLVSLLKYHSLFSVDEMNVWFTPVSINISDGIAKTGRMDALVADSLHVCTWGDINLDNHKLNMILGLTAEALSKAFSLHNLADEYVCQIQLKGTTQNPKIDMGKAAAKIAALIAMNANTQVRFFGRGLQRKLGKELPAPPPNLPYPWEENSSSSEKPKKKGILDLFE